ncbi:MAG: vitamin K epoxide reductase family protein [bacterium]
MKAFFTRIAPWAILLAAFLGLADSVYLARSELSGAPLLCNIDGLSGCNLVAQSPYSQLFGVPLAVYGLGFYALLFILAALELAWSSSRLRKMLLALTLFGVAVSLVSLLLQLFVIQALCIYCAFSWAVALLAWLFSRLLPGSKFWRREHLTDAPS